MVYDREILNLLCLPISPLRDGAPGRTRTCDPGLRKPLRCPTTLQEQNGTDGRVRTDDNYRVEVVLYQLSYIRVFKV